MFKEIFRRSTEVPYNPLQNDLSTDDVALDIKSHVRVSRIVRHSRDKSIKQNLKEKLRTLHTLSLCRLPTNNKSLRDFCPRNGEIEKVLANLKGLKSLRCLNIDLCWLLTIKTGHAQFAESLKHLKKLSVIHFYVAEENVTLSNIPHLYQSVSHIRMVHKAEIRLSFSNSFGIAGGSFDQLLRALSPFGCLTSVHLTFDSFSFLAIQRIIASLQGYKSVSRIDITITKILSLFHSPPLQDSLFESLKNVKSLKEARITFKGLGDLALTDLKTMRPKLKEAVQIFNLAITFQMRPKRFRRLTTSEWAEFIESLQKSDSPYRLHISYVGKFHYSLTPIILTILVVLIFIYSVFYLVVDLFLNWNF